MSWNLWWIFVGTSIVLAITPGPAVMLVLSSGIRYGAKRSIVTICGILSANALYFVLSATGLGALLHSSYQLFFLIKWVGAAYLIFLGLKALLSREGSFQVDATAAPQRSPARMYVDGFLLQSSNPKVFLYFGAVIPQFIDAARPIAPQTLILGITGVAIEFIVQSGYALAAGRVSEAARQPRFARWTSRIAGLFLIGAGGGLAMVNRD